MKRTLTLLVAALLLSIFSQSQAQVLLTSGFETWSGAHHPAGWVGTKTNIDTTTGIVLYTSSTHAGTKAVQLVNASTTHKRFTTQGLSVESGASYEIAYWVRGHGNIRCAVTDLTNYSSYVPSAYHQINSTTWTQYKDTVIGPGTNAAGEFIISVQSTNADLEHLQVDDVTITKLNISIPVLSIYDIQYTADVAGASLYANDMVTTGGIVTAFSPYGYFIQSHPGAWNGIYIYDQSNTVARGDSVIVTGQVYESFDMTEIKSLVDFTKVSSGNPLPAAEVVPTVLVNSENYESVLMKLVNVLCTDTTAGYGMSHVYDGNDTTLVDDEIYDYVLTPSLRYDITGVGFYSYSEYKICPRDINDIVLNTSSIDENNAVSVMMYPNPVLSELNLFVNGQVEVVMVADMLGHQILSKNIKDQNNVSIDFSTLRPGNYMVSLLNNGEVVARQIIVRN